MTTVTWSIEHVFHFLRDSVLVETGCPVAIITSKSERFNFWGNHCFCFSYSSITACKGLWNWISSPPHRSSPSITPIRLISARDPFGSFLSIESLCLKQNNALATQRYAKGNWIFEVGLRWLHSNNFLIPVRLQRSKCGCCCRRRKQRQPGLNRQTLQVKNFSAVFGTTKKIKEATNTQKQVQESIC